MTSLAKKLKAWREPLEACDRAAQLLKATGFELRNAAMKLESCYYGWPGHKETIRVSAHRTSGSAAGVLDTVVAKITISAEMCMYQGGVKALPDQKLREIVARAIGHYFMKIADVG